MKLPPALSWMHLFPREASFEWGAAPERLRALPNANPRNGGELVRVGGSDFGNGGWVGINSRVGDAELRNSGFAYVRRFAVLPDLKAARWFVPLDSPAVSCAAFSLYSPARFSARLKVAAAKIATSLRLPVWYRDSIVIAQRKLPPIERKMGELFGGADFRLALSSGAPEPAKNRKVSLAVIGTDGRIIGFGKIAGSELSERLMRDESRALPELVRRNIGAPELLFAGEVDGAFVTVQKPLRGKPVPSKLSQSTLSLLHSLRSNQIQIAAECSMLAGLPDRIADQPNLMDAFEEVLPILQETRVPSTIVHGDFAPWNLRASQGNTVAFDWEYAELDGLPLIDETHYRLQVGYLLDAWDASRACAALEQMRAQNDLSLTIDQARAVQVVYLIDQLARLFAEGYDETENDMVGWYCQLLRRLVPARKARVAV